MYHISADMPDGSRMEFEARDVREAAYILENMSKPLVLRVYFMLDKNEVNALLDGRTEPKGFGFSPQVGE